jgi:threonine dehydratase
MGIQVDPQQLPEFRQLLDDLDYPCWEETENPAYKLFAGVG